MENREQITEQLLNGIGRLCKEKEDCNGCIFYSSECLFGDPKPRTWFEESKAEEKIVETPASEPEPAPEPAAPEPAAPVIPAPATEPEHSGTWLVSTTMGSVLSKYVFICSKCGFRKESYLSIAPSSFCPECEKRKAEQNS